MSVQFAAGGLPAGYRMPSNDDLGPLALRTIWTLLSISTVVILARLVVKYKTTRRIYWDDFLMVLALVSGLRILSWFLLTLQRDSDTHMLLTYQ